MQGNDIVFPNSPTAIDTSRPPVGSLSPHSLSLQSSNYAGSAGLTSTAIEGTREIEAPLHGHRDYDTHERQGPLAAGSRQGRPNTIVTEVRPPISQRSASLSAYRATSAASASSPYSPSFGHDNRSSVQPTTTDHASEKQDAAHVSSSQSAPLSRPIMSANTVINTRTARTSIPPRPARSPLRLSPQPDSQSNANGTQIEAFELIRKQQGSSPHGDPNYAAPRTHRKAESSSTIPTLKAASTLSTQASVDGQPISPVHYPFHVLRSIWSSMTTPHGALLIQGLYVPRTAWSVTGAKLPALDTKIRVMMLLSQHLNTVTETGHPLLQMGGSGKTASFPAALKAFIVALDDLEALTVECQKILAKKVGDGKIFAKPRKPNTVRTSLLFRNKLPVN